MEGICDNCKKQEWFDGVHREDNNCIRELRNQLTTATARIAELEKQLAAVSDEWDNERVKYQAKAKECEGVKGELIEVCKKVSLGYSPVAQARYILDNRELSDKPTTEGGAG